MTFENGTRVRVKILGHRIYGQVVETVAQHAKPTAKPDRFYHVGGNKHAWSCDSTETLSASGTVLVRIESGKLYRVLPTMLERT